MSQDPCPRVPEKWQQMHQSPWNRKTVMMGSVRRSVRPGASYGSGNDKIQLLGREGRAWEL